MGTSQAPNQIDNKLFPIAVDAVVRTAPDVRVFNCSFDTPPLKLMQEIDRQQSLILTRDLDNFIFQHDVIVVVAAGNSGWGTIPQETYPNHFADLRWHLGAFASSFNALTCGSYVSQIAPDGLVQTIGWPSPFCRMGPGIGHSRKPDFSASGGDQTKNYHSAAGLGVWGIDSFGVWTERCGTSYAAPLLAREAALLLQALSRVCLPGTKPYGVTAKAFLALTAASPSPELTIAKLVRNTLGYGTAQASTLGEPSANTAVFLWQGLLEDKDDIIRVQLPVPRSWLKLAGTPMLRIVLASDVPTNDAATRIWASRKVGFQLKPTPEAPPLRGKKNTGGANYTLVSREFDLAGHREDGDVNDLWIIEVSYSEVADYYPGQAFSPQQRAALAVELFDSKEKVSPQEILQAMPITSTMVRLTTNNVTTRVPVFLQ